jgi:hypothetical protein
MLSTYATHLGGAAVPPAGGIAAAAAFVSGFVAAAGGGTGVQLHLRCAVLLQVAHSAHGESLLTVLTELQLLLHVWPCQ